MKALKKTKLETKKLIAELRKEGIKRKEALWKDLAERIAKSSRKKARVNLWKIEKIAEKFGKKIFVVPGKVLGTGTLNSKIEIAAMEFSHEAVKKIAEKKGSALSLKELLEKKAKASELMIVK